MNTLVHNPALVTLPPARRPVLVSNTLRRRIWRDVITAHVVFVLLPAVWFFAKQWWLSRRPPAIKVTLVSEPLPPSPVPTPAPPVVTPPTPPPPKPDPPRPPDPPPPTPPKPVPIPPVPTPVPPKPAPVPPKPTPVPKPQPTPEPPKTWQPRSANEITVSKKVVKQTNPTPTVSASEIEARLRNLARQIHGTTATTGPVAQVPQSYYETVAAFLYQRWDQPSRSELGDRRPRVGVLLAVEANGRVRSAKITRRSGIPAMDASVEALLSSLTMMPAPPNGAMTLDVNLEIVDNLGGVLR